MMQFLSGVLGAIIGGAIVAWFNYQYIWKSQKKLEMMRLVFDDAMKALALYEVDVQNKDLQDLQPETKLAQAKALALVPSFFPEASDAYRHVFDSGQKLRAMIDDGYYKRVDEAVNLMAKELHKPETGAPWERIQFALGPASKKGNNGK
jgi:acyl-CoA synthetase (AMP-forming)/AMP-acid ligase II